jgi:hypothetical protein
VVGSELWGARVILRQDKEKTIQLFICINVPDKENEHELFIVIGYK